MKYFKNLIFVSIFIFLTVSCSTPINEYKQKIENKNIREKISEIQDKRIELIIDDFINSFINDKNNYDIIDEKFKALGYNSIISEIKDYQNMVEELLKEVSSIKSNDSLINETNNKLIQVIKNYETIGKNAEIYLITFKEIYEYLFEIEKNYNKAVNLALSGNPTSINFSSELFNILSEYESELEIFNIDIVEEKFQEENLDVIWFEEKVTLIEKIINKIENIEVIEEKDEESKEIILDILLNVKSLFHYIIKNKSNVEWINQYETFTDYSKELINEAQLLLNDWEKELENDS